MLPIETISAEELDVYVGRRDAVLIDLREPEEYEKKHIRTAVNIPYGKLQDCRKYSRKKMTEQPRTAAERNLEDGNAAKWRAKYIPERPLSRNNSSINFPVIRFSDVLLMVAECINHVNNGPTQEAFNALNRVRRRAGASEKSMADASGFNSFDRLVREERTRELCFEVPRRMELRRHGADYFASQIAILADQSLNQQNKKIGYDLESIKAQIGRAHV